LAQVLQLHEAKAIRADQKCLARVQRSYEMMVDFYGLKLVDRETGSIQALKTTDNCTETL
jgi:hypothetical protein